MRTAQHSLIIFLSVILFCLPIQAQPEDLAQSADQIKLDALITKIYLAYGGKESLAQLDKKYVIVGQQKVTSTSSGISNNAS